MRILLLFLSAILLASCGGFTQRKYLERTFQVQHTVRSSATRAVVSPPAPATAHVISEKTPDVSSAPSDTVLPADTTPKNIFDKFRAANDADRARRSVKTGLLSAAGALVYYASGYLTLTQAPDASDGQGIVVVFLVLIPLCFLVGMLAMALGIFAMYRGFRVKKNRKGEEKYEGKNASTAGILLGLFGALLTIAATILLRQL